MWTISPPVSNIRSTNAPALQYPEDKQHFVHTMSLARQSQPSAVRLMSRLYPVIAPATLSAPTAFELCTTCQHWTLAAKLIQPIHLVCRIVPCSFQCTTNNSTLAIWEGIQESYSQADLNLFFANFTPFIPQGTRPIYTSIDGGVGPASQADTGVEAQLDLTLAYGLTYPASINFYSVDDPYWSYNAYGFMDTTLDALDGVSCLRHCWNFSNRCC